MVQQWEEKLPQWYKSNAQYDLVLSNDIDSLASCALLNKIKGWDIGYFYDFNASYQSDNLPEPPVMTEMARKIFGNIGDVSEEQYKSDRRIWVDVAVKNGERAFDNHVSRFYSQDEKYFKQMINPNLLTGVSNDWHYTDKYAGSTLLVLWSLYNLPLPETEEGKMLLLSIDVAFKGYYTDRFKDANIFYIERLLGFGELIEVMNRHSKEEFYGIIKKYGLNKDITMDTDTMTIRTELDLNLIGDLLGLNITLPLDKFKEWQRYKIIEAQANEYHEKAGNVFSLAFTYKNSVRYSKVLEEDKFIF